MEKILFFVLVTTSLVHAAEGDDLSKLTFRNRVPRFLKLTKEQRHPVFFAVKNDNVDELRDFLTAGYDPNKPFYHVEYSDEVSLPEYPIEVIIGKKAAQLLLAAGANVRVKRTDENPAPIVFPYLYRAIDQLNIESTAPVKELQKLKEAIQKIKEIEKKSNYSGHKLRVDHYDITQQIFAQLSLTETKTIMGLCLDHYKRLEGYQGIESVEETIKIFMEYRKRLFMKKVS